jgi:diaminohydroxyphosphoribosylaminopyrimidine deaminase/5-amino-6-(5-phosphoribosylamino)uracil reductase
VDLVIERGVKRLVVAHGDPNPLVSGKGLARARSAGVEVQIGILEMEARWLNRRFLCHHEKHRPYILLKWARSADGRIDDHGRTARISAPATDVLVHQWRSEVQAIAVGSGTVMTDDPQLTVRHVAGASPLRVVIDRAGSTSDGSRVFDRSASNLLVTSRKRSTLALDQLMVEAGSSTLEILMKELFHRQVTSLMVEGGAGLLTHFLSAGLWDEARVITGRMRFGGGTPSPEVPGDPVRSIMCGDDRIDLFVNGTAPDPAWDW